MQKTGILLTYNLYRMKELFYYILAALGGGLVSEINSKHEDGKPDIKHLFIRGFTSVMIGVIFGLTFESLTGNVKLTIAITALAGVVGYASLEWIIKLFKTKAEKYFTK